LTAVGRDAELPLSFAQQRLWFLDQLEPDSPFYNTPIAVRLTGVLDVTALHQSLDEIIRRHEVLRTTFAAVNGRPVQVISPKQEMSLPLIDLTEGTASEREAEARRLALQEAMRPFNLGTGPLARATLLRFSAEEHVALFSMHHIISDAWSMNVLIKEITTLYGAFIRGEESPLLPLPIQYADYAHWQQKWLQGAVLEEELSYWKRQLAGTPAVLELPTDYTRPSVQSLRGSTQSFRLSEDLTQQLRELCRKENVTLFMTLLSAFQILLARYSGQEDINIGTIIAGRHRRETEDLIGFFVNTLVMRAEVRSDWHFVDLLRRVREVCLGAYAHQELPFERLVEELQPTRSLAHTPLFQIAFGLDNAPKQVLELPGLTLEPMPMDHGAVRYDLTLWMHDGGKNLGGIWTYSTDLFTSETINRMTGHFKALLENIIAQPQARLSSFEMLTAEERRKRVSDEERLVELNTAKLLNVKRKPVNSVATL
jgi:hypothetical protein